MAHRWAPPCIPSAGRQRASPALCALPGQTARGCVCSAPAEWFAQGRKCQQYCGVNGASSAAFVSKLPAGELALSNQRDTVLPCVGTPRDGDTRMVSRMQRVGPRSLQLQGSSQLFAFPCLFYFPQPAACHRPSKPIIPATWLLLDPSGPLCSPSSSGHQHPWELPAPD